MTQLCFLSLFYKCLSQTLVNSGIKSFFLFKVCGSINQIIITMKKIMNLSFLLFLQLIFANVNPNIGVVLEQQNPTDFNSNCVFNFSIKIKNNGDVPLFNVFIQNIQAPYQDYKHITISGSAIISLQPGESNDTAFSGTTNSLPSCTLLTKQIEVVSTTASGSVITDLSHPDNYFLDQDTYVILGNSSLNISKLITYLDLNLNSIVDVGDAVKYNYSIHYYEQGCFNNGFVNILPIETGVSFNLDNLSVNANSTVSNTSLEGMHYLTNQDVNLGYVYGSNSGFVFFNGVNQLVCSVINTYLPTSSFSIPNGFDSVIKLTDLIPNKISGSVTYNNGNNNCATGIGANSKVKASDGTVTYETFTNSNSDYSILIPNNGNFNVALDGQYNSTHFLINPTNHSVTSSLQNQVYANKNFCISTVDNFSNLSISIYPSDGMPSRPGFDSEFIISISNTGSTMLNANVSLNYDGNKVSFLNAIPSSVANANTVNWNINNMAPFEVKSIKVTFNVATPPTVVSGSILPFQLNVNANSQNYSAILNQEVVNSYDPNDISVLEGETINSNGLNKELHYLIRFQNTGTAAATTVVVKQFLDEKLDWDTFEPIAASHENLIQVKNSDKVSYTFSNINLASSDINESQSHGWLLYKIKPKSTLVVGDVMQGTANIYFDFNPPIITNTAIVEVVNQTLSNDIFETNNSIQVYPNPTSDFINVEVKNNEILNFTIINQLGQVVKIFKTNDYLTKIDIRDLTKGVYYLVCSNSQVPTKRIVLK